MSHHSKRSGCDKLQVPLVEFFEQGLIKRCICRYDPHDTFEEEEAMVHFMSPGKFHVLL